MLKNIALALAVALGITGLALGQEVPTSSIQIEDSMDIGQVTSDFPVPFALLTAGETQYVAYYDELRRMTVASRSLDSNEWTYQILPSNVGWDSHNYITMAMDDTGHLHVSGNMHVNPLIYFRTETPGDITTLNKLSMTGERENRCTYPRFMRDADNRLVFTYRDGTSSNGIQIYNVYNPITKTWTRLLDTPLLDGEGHMNAYGGPRRGPDGLFHMVWVWRDTPDAATNHHLSYARSRDLIHWESAFSENVNLPITIGKEELWLDPIPPYGGIINGGARLFFGRDKRPIVNYHKNDENGNMQVYIARPEMGNWVIRQLTDWDQPVVFGGTGSLGFIGISISGLSRAEDGLLSMTYRHRDYGSGRLMIDEETLTVQSIDENYTTPNETYPEVMTQLQSDFEGMGIQRRGDIGDSGEENIRYILQWETLGRNGDKKPNPPLPQPSTLKLYKLRYPDSGIDFGYDPTISLLTPANTATGVPVDTPLVMTFDEDVIAGSGVISLYKASDNTLVESFDVTDVGQVEISGAQVTLNPSADLLHGTSYYVTIDATAFDDLQGNSFAGLSLSSDWRFTTYSGEAFGISYHTITGDEDCGITNSKTYTHVVDFGTDTPRALINGVQFQAGGATFGSKTGTSATIGTGTTTITSAHTGNSEAAPYLNGASACAMEDLVEDMNYNIAAGTITLTGLTPGQPYRFRLYNRQWGPSAGSNRGQNIGFDTDGVGSSIFECEYTGAFEADDATQPDPGLPTSSQVYAYTCDYKLAPGVTELKVYINVKADDYGTYHMYGLSNEEVAGSTIGNLAPSDITGSAATLNATLRAQDTNYTVSVHWGPGDGSDNADGWLYSAAIGSFADITTNLTYQASGLEPGQAYYYTFTANNGESNIWASPSRRFVTEGTPTPRTQTLIHAVPHTWLDSQNGSWAGDYETAVAQDQDSDGFTTWQEYWAGTDPTNSESFLKIDHVYMQGGDLHIESQHANPAAAIPPIAIYATSNLTTGPWLYVGEYDPVDGTNTWQHPASQQPASRQLFYRLEVTSAP